MPSDEELTFCSIIENAQTEFRRQAHRETSRLTFGAGVTAERIAQSMEAENETAANDPESSVIAYHSGVPAGLVLVQIRSGDDGPFAYVHFLYVAPEFRRRGYGVQLLKYAEGYFQRRGFTKYCLRTSELNPNAREFYEHNGFKLVAKLEKTSNGVKLPLYVKRFCTDSDTVRAYYNCDA
jgi:ribosomal protein S18 acetylase RimI-like enzyme